MFRDESPALRTVLLYEVEHLLVLLLGPRSLDQVRIEDFLPPMLTLNVRAVGEEARDEVPVAASAVSLHDSFQLLILKLLEMKS